MLSFLGFFFSFWFSEKLFMLFLLNYNLVVLSILGWMFFPFITLKISQPFHLIFKVSTEKSADSRGVSLVWLCFSPIALGNPSGDFMLLGTRYASSTWWFPLISSNTFESPLSPFLTPLVCRLAHLISLISFVALICFSLVFLSALLTGLFPLFYLAGHLSILPSYLACDSLLLDWVICYLGYWIA